MTSGKGLNESTRDGWALATEAERLSLGLEPRVLFDEGGGRGEHARRVRPGGGIRGCC